VIVIPMAGLSSRFRAQGFSLPKYMLEIDHRPMFVYSTLSFRKYFSSEKFLFIYRDICGTDTFVRTQVKNLGIANPIFINLGHRETEGQAHTVELGLISAGVDLQEPLFIFNIDTIRPEFSFPNFLIDSNCSGYIEVFKGDGENWSFIETSSDNTRAVSRTAEKERISDLCSTGLYFFKSRALFSFAYELSKHNKIKGEAYIAPMYNHLIAKGDQVFFDLVDNTDVIFAGTPDEFKAIKPHRLNSLFPVDFLL